MRIKVLIILFVLLLLSCENRYITRNVYGRTFTDKDYAITDIYYQLDYFDVYPICLDEWITLVAENDTIFIEQKMIHKFINAESRYQFIFTTYVYPSSTSYSFTIRYSGLKKDFKQ